MFLSLQAGKGLVKVNGRPLSLVQPEILRFKVRPPRARPPESIEIESSLWYPDRRALARHARYHGEGATNARGARALPADND